MELRIQREKEELQRSANTLRLLQEQDEAEEREYEQLKIDSAIKAEAEREQKARVADA